MESTASTYSAVRDFRNARSRANRERLMARLTGRAANLFCYEDVRDQLGARPGQSLGLMVIPLDAIVGSVGRCSDFTRSFLPLKDSDQSRWTSVQTVVKSLQGLPPITAYRLGEAYFVADGNHRVSVARQSGLRDIDAMVTEIRTPVPLSPGDRPQDLPLKAEFSTFLQDTHLDRVRPEANLTFTRPGQAAILREQIDRYHRALARRQQRQIRYEDAVGGWYDEVYEPFVRFLRNWTLSPALPGLSETEVYLLLCEHREHRESMREALGWQVELEAAAEDYVRHSGPSPRRTVARAGKRILDTFTTARTVQAPG